MGSCVPVANQSTAACGLGASACGICTPGQECVNGACIASSNPCLEFSSFDLDFGPTQISCYSYLNVLLTNRCSAALTVNSLTLSLSDYSFYPAASLPVTLLTNQGLPVSLRMSPSSTGPRVGSLVVTWTSGASYQSTLGLFGSGSSGASVTESYAVPMTADLLLVVDDSGSMADKQNSFSTNMANFMSYATAQNVSWNAAVINHDNDVGTTKGGNFIGVPKVISSSLGNAVQTLATRVQLGTNGSATEVGLTTAWKALTPPLVGGGNAGFLRPGSTLSFVFLTDAEDQSVGPMSAWVSHLRSLRGGRARNATTALGFVPLGGGTCGYDAPPSGRYEGVMANFGGFREDICDHALAASWSRLGERAAGKRMKWYLANAPTSASALNVSVGGVLVSPSTWTYDPATNTVSFYDTSAPRPGQSVVFSYAAICAQ